MLAAALAAAVPTPTHTPHILLHWPHALTRTLHLFYAHSDFDEMEQLFSQEINPNIDMEELEAMATEFRNDYNQRHFVRNDTFKAAAAGITGETRKIFIEFLERSCTAEFSGFLLYKVRCRAAVELYPLPSSAAALLPCLLAPAPRPSMEAGPPPPVLSLLLPTLCCLPRSYRSWAVASSPPTQRLLRSSPSCRAMRRAMPASSTRQ